MSVIPFPPQEQNMRYVVTFIRAEEEPQSHLCDFYGVSRENSELFMIGDKDFEDDIAPTRFVRLNDIREIVITTVEVEDGPDQSID